MPAHSAPFDFDEERPEQTEVWRALASPVRRQILDLLREQPRTTGVLAAQFPISRIAVMRHLEVLASAGLVASRKRGRERWHYVNTSALLGLADRWVSPAAAGWARTLQRLRETVEGAPVELAIDIALDVEIGGPPERVCAALTRDPGAWWGHPYLRPGTTELSIDARIGGEFVEHWPTGSARIATVTALDPDRLLELSGPFHLGVALGVARYALAPDGPHTMLRFTFGAVGAVDPDVAAGFEGGWRELVTRRLKAFVEDGTRLGVTPDAATEEQP